MSLLRDEIKHLDYFEWTIRTIPSYRHNLGIIPRLFSDVRRKREGKKQQNSYSCPFCREEKSITTIKEIWKCHTKKHFFGESQLLGTFRPEADVTPWKVIRISETRNPGSKIFATSILSESMAQAKEIFACKIRNPGLWSPEIQNPADDLNPESKFHWQGIRNEVPRKKAWNPKSKTVSDYLTWGETLRVIPHQQTTTLLK